MNKKQFLILTILIVFPAFAFAQDAKTEVKNQINSLPINTGSKTYENLLKQFANYKGDVKEIEDGILRPVNEGNYEIIPLIETIILPYQTNIHSLVDYYLYIGAAIGSFCDNPAKAIEYLKKGLDLAENNNLKKKLFRSLNGRLTPIWGDIAVNYQRKNDFKNAAYAYLNGAKEIKKYYPITTKEFNDYLGLSSFLMFQYLTEVYKGDDKYGEYLPFILEYSSIGNLKCLSTLWDSFITSQDTDGLFLIEINLISKEEDNNAIAEFYWAIAEQFQHDELYREAINYHLQLIAHCKLNNIKDYLFIEIDGIQHSRFEYIAYCFDKLGENDNSVQSILNAMNEIVMEYGTDSEEFKYYSDYLLFLMEDPTKGEILQRKLNEMGY